MLFWLLSIRYKQSQLHVGNNPNEFAFAFCNHMFQESIFLMKSITQIFFSKDLRVIETACNHGMDLCFCRVISTFFLSIFRMIEREEWSFETNSNMWSSNSYVFFADSNYIILKHEFYLLLDFCIEHITRY